MNFPALSAVLDKVRDLLTGETLRAINYGAAAVIFVIAKASGRIDDIPFSDAIVLTATAATFVVGITEAARRYVFSPNTVEAIVTEQAEDGVEDPNT